MAPSQKPGRSKQDYGTPPEFLKAVKQRLHITEFGIDLAASRENKVVNHECFYDERRNALDPNNHWNYGWAWCNPPFGHIEPWVKKACQEASIGAHIVMLVPASVGSKWWSTWVEGFAYVSFLHGRLTFVGETTPYIKDCALLLYEPWGMTGHEIWYWRNSIVTEG